MLETNNQWREGERGPTERDKCHGHKSAFRSSIEWARMWWWWRILHVIFLKLDSSLFRLQCTQTCYVGSKGSGWKDGGNISLSTCLRFSFPLDTKEMSENNGGKDLS